MRLRNIKNAQNIVNNHYLVTKENPFKGNISLEIGCGKGDFIIELAKRNPQNNYIAIEKYESVLLRALQKAEKENLTNLRFMNIDAKELSNYFNNNVNEIYLNFSDPWPKKRHIKRRLCSPNFISEYENISHGKIQIIMKTDNKDLFAYAIQTFNNLGFIINEISLNLPLENSIETEYEKKFREKGIFINYLKVEKIIMKKQ